MALFNFFPFGMLQFWVKGHFTLLNLYFASFTVVRNSFLFKTLSLAFHELFQT